MTKYFITPKTSIELSENNEIEPGDIEIALMAILGYEPSEVEGVTVWVSGNERYWLVQQQQLPAEEAARNEAITAINQKTGASPLAPTLDPSFAQLLMRQMPMNITGEAFVAGSLAGMWRVERIGQYAPYNVRVNGILTGKSQPMSYTSASLPLSVAMLFLQAMGVGQRAYVIIPESPDAEPQLVYMTAENEDGLQKLLPAASLYRMESLDKYAVVGLEADMVKDAIEKAQLLRTIKLAELATAPQPEPALVAAASEAEPAAAEEAAVSAAEPVAQAAPEHA